MLISVRKKLHERAFRTMYPEELQSQREAIAEDEALSRKTLQHLMVQELTVKRSNNRATGCNVMNL